MESVEPVSVAGRLRRWSRRASRAALALGIGSLALLVWLATRSEEPGFDPAAAAGVVLGEAVPLVPGPGLPAELEPMAANNNVDLAQLDGRTFLAFRTAPSHFASDRAVLPILGSSDRHGWELETVVRPAEPGDLREPRFLVHEGRLLFYFFRGGSDPFAFEPHRPYVMERSADGRWSEPVPYWRSGYVVWRVRSHGGRAYMTVYRGDGLYTTARRPGEVRLLVSDDGLEWSPITPEPQVVEDGASEAEFLFDDDGGLVATVRLEVQGSLVCRARPRSLGDWRCRRHPEKLDSALLIRGPGGRPYALARRNVAGAFRRGPEPLPESWRRGWSLVRYSLTRKRTALYAIDPLDLDFTPLLDLPSRGDTAFAAAVELAAGRYYVVNYTSPLDGPDVPWLLGQLRPTHLYAIDLALPPSDG